MLDAKIEQKLTNFRVLELKQADGGSDNVGLVTKKLPLHEIKKVCDKIFFQDPSKDPRGQNVQKRILGFQFFP